MDDSPSTELVPTGGGGARRRGTFIGAHRTADPWQSDPVTETESPDAALDRLVDAVVERIEERVIEELERRGRRHSWGVF